MSKTRPKPDASWKLPAATPVAAHTRATSSSATVAVSGTSRGAAVRETIESIVIAFVLAFLFRTFVAEAFVIPTGSMAITLMGRHKDLNCPQCGTEFQVSASEEVRPDAKAEGHVLSGVCPTCFLPVDLHDSSRYPSFSGDRIIVAKSAYVFDDPQRFDVAVFKFPQDAPMNYIKRVVGLPNETIRLTHGDVFVRHDDGNAANREGAAKNAANEFTIVRKPPHKLLAMMRTVYDNAYAPQLAGEGWPPRWQAEPAEGVHASVGGWTASADGRSFETVPTTQDSWLRYQHLVPTYEQWEARTRRLPLSSAVRPQLISDFLAYNSGQSPWPPYAAMQSLMVGQHWVGDLALECEVESLDGKGEWTLELNKGGRRFQCGLDLATGKATLGISGDDMRDFHPAAETALRGKGRHEVRFSNCDDELLLWIDGSVVDFGPPGTRYRDLDNHLPTLDDLKPAGIAARGAAIRVQGLRLLRDLYYIAPRPSITNQVTEFEGPVPPEMLWNPRLWDYFKSPPSVEYSMAADQFLMLGDNSAKSLDGRLWGPPWGSGQHYVNRELLIGKAVFIYWPHPLNQPIPFFPNFWRMGFVH